MLTRCMSAVIAIVLVSFASTSNAQVLNRAAGGTTNPGSNNYRTNYYVPSDTMSILRLPQFKKELELLDDQVEEIRMIQEEMQTQTREIFKDANFNRDAAQVVREAHSAIREQTEERLKKVLLPHQVKRLKQLQFQMQLRSRGASSLTSGALADALKMTDKQKTELAEKQQASQAKLQEEIEQLREKYQQQVLEDVLTKTQLRELKKLVGDEYEVKRPDYRSMYSGNQK